MRSIFLTTAFSAVSGLAWTIGAVAAQAPRAPFVGISAELPTGSRAIAADGLVAAYDMATLTADGRLRDFGGFGNHGVVRREQDPVAGPIGSARTFRTVKDRVHLGESDAFDLDGPLTIAAWLRVDRVGLHQHVVACDDKWALWITPDDQFRLGDTRGGGLSTSAGRAVAGEWVSVVAVLRGTRGDSLSPEIGALFVDGRPTDDAAHLRTDAARAAPSWEPGDLYSTDACYIGFESHQGNAAHQQMPFVGAVVRCANPRPIPYNECRSNEVRRITTEPGEPACSSP